MQRAGADKACALFFCLNDRDFNADALVPIRQTFPKTRIFARAYDRRQAIELMQDKEITIVRETFESSVKLAADGLKSFGLAKAQIEKVIAEFRTRDRNRLIEQFESGDMHAGQRHSFGGDDSDDFLLDQS